MTTVSGTTRRNNSHNSSGTKRSARLVIPTQRPQPPKETMSQYGINFRRPSGQSYSAADPLGSPHTRNLGIVMEGACDREARRITRETAVRFGIREPDDPLGQLAFRDVTGTLSDEDVTAGREEEPVDEVAGYVERLRRYEAGVNRRYAVFLS
ncbi:hypothetical protein [Streptomyces bauhiniae]|uniref:hypothetical protein n=1 Tax=Streptomyces bauhiniae TaxID=2340725 RepID=UPI00364DE98C